MGHGEIATIAAVEDLISRREYREALRLIDNLVTGSNKSDTEPGPPIGTSPEVTLDIARAECLAFVGEYELSRTLARKHAAALRRGERHSDYARACFVLAVAEYLGGDLATASESVNLALYTYKRAEDPAGVARSLSWRGNILYDRGQYANALESYTECEVVARYADLNRWIANARANAARVLIRQGRLLEAQKRFEGVREVLSELGEHLNAARVDLSKGYLNLLQHRFDSARATFAQMEPGLSSLPARERGIWYEYSGELALCTGDYAAARRHLETAIEIGGQSGPDESLIGQSRRLLAQVYAAEGRMGDALAECERALVSIRKVGERHEEGVVDRVIGQAQAALGNLDAATKAFRRSADALRGIGARLELARTDLAAGQTTMLEERERVAYLLEAERLFDEIGVIHWIEQTRDAIACVGPKSPQAEVRKSPSMDGGSESTFITRDKSTIQTLHLAEKFASGDLCILITGETGTGKDLLARWIHAKSQRRKGPFVDIDLSTLPETVWESELFGHRKGAFTGATADKAGLLESGDGGTVFLNEIGNLSLHLQAKLLEFLDSHNVRRVGDTRSRSIDVRLIAATNGDLARAMAAGGFRSDLYYRLSQAPLHLGPLRERREDIVPLLRHFLDEFEVPAAVAGDVLKQQWVQRACSYSWPGNARELRSFVWRLATVASVEPAAQWETWADALLDYLERASGEFPALPDSRRHELLHALDENDWNQRAAARRMNVSEATIRKWMRRHSIQRLPPEAGTPPEPPASFH